VFVDVDGTLIVPDWHTKAPKLNPDLVERLDAHCPRGTSVTVFSGGDPAVQTARLRELGFPERFLPVKSKSDFKGMKLEIVFDDTHPAIQGFTAVHLNPRDLAKFDPEGALAKLREIKAKTDGLTVNLRDETFPLRPAVE
jgi:hypothetical protein